MLQSTAAIKRMMALERRNQKVVSLKERKKKEKERRVSETKDRNKADDETVITIGVFLLGLLLVLWEIVWGMDFSGV